jgi:predicted metalloendopeptidase
MFYIKISEEHDAAGFYLLMTNGTVKCLPDNVYLVDEKQIELLDQHKIHYEKMREEIFPQKRNLFYCI